MSEPARIAAVGAACGSWRLRASDVADAWDAGSSKGRTAVAATDEDTLTLAWDAATNALRAVRPDAGELAGPEIDGLWWGTSEPPFADGPSHAVLASALGLSAASTGALHSGSPHAGIEALLGAADAIRAGSASRALVVASDAIVPGTGTALERRAGAGAVALLLERDGPAGLGPRVTRTRPVLDRYRGSHEAATRDPYDPRLQRDEILVPAVREIVEHLAVFEPTGWSLPDPDGRAARSIARELTGTLVSDAVFSTVGDTGAAAALLGAAASLDAAGVFAVIGYGGGRTTGLLLESDAPVPGAAAVAAALERAVDASYPEVLRSRGQLTAHGETVEMGVPPGSAMFTRGTAEMLGPLGARCVDCDTVNTPPSIHPHCVNCGGTKFEEVTLAETGTVHTYVVNRTMPAPFVAPLPLAVIDLDDGARIMLQVTGEPDGLGVDSRVELVLRRYAYERGVPVYGYKARLLASPAPTSTGGN